MFTVVDDARSVDDSDSDNGRGASGSSLGEIVRDTARQNSDII